jgi:hypothetical protein
MDTPLGAEIPLEKWSDDYRSRWQNRVFFLGAGPALVAVSLLGIIVIGVLHLYRGDTHSLVYGFVLSIVLAPIAVVLANSWGRMIMKNTGWLAPRVNYFCPACHTHIPSDVPWICPFCHAEHESPSGAESFLCKCSNCQRPSTAFQCASCDRVVRLEGQGHDLHIAKKLTAPRPGETLEQARVRRQREREDDENLLEELSRKRKVAEAREDLRRTEERIKREGQPRDVSAEMAARTAQVIEEFRARMASMTKIVASKVDIARELDAPQYADLSAKDKAFILDRLEVFVDATARNIAQGNRQ